MVNFREAKTTYLGKRESVAVVYIGNQGFPLSMGETLACAAGVETCELTLCNLGVPRRQAEQFAPGLMQFCRELTNFKQGFFSKENPNGVKRDRPRPRIWRRQYY